MRGLDASALQLSGAQSVIDLCCEVNVGGACTSNLQPGGVYLPGELICALQVSVYVLAGNALLVKACFLVDLRTGSADASNSTCELGCLDWRHFACLVHGVMDEQL